MELLESHDCGHKDEGTLAVIVSGEHYGFVMCDFFGLLGAGLSPPEVEYLRAPGPIPGSGSDLVDISFRLLTGSKIQPAAAFRSAPKRDDSESESAGSFPSRPRKRF